MLLCPISFIAYFYEKNIIVDIMGGGALLAVIICYWLLKYNALLTKQNIPSKPQENLSKIKRDIKIKISVDILKILTFIYMILFITISSTALYDDTQHNDIIYFSMFFSVILSGFTYFYLPKYEKLLIGGLFEYEKGQKQNINKPVKKISLTTMVKNIVAMFVVMMLMTMAIATIIVLIYCKQYVLAILFTGIVIIMSMALFAALIGFMSNLYTTTNENQKGHTLENITTIAIYLYFFGNKNNR
jgi:MFS family permease